MLDNIRIVLTNTFHPGNIGSTARAMKTMGLEQLYLVSPREFPSPEADKMAAGAQGMLEDAVVVDTLAEAVADCSLVVGASARTRSFPLPMLDARECGQKLVQESAVGPVALVFGRERMGLHNDEIQLCNFQVYIPGNPEYCILNLAQAVQLLSYEVRMAWLQTQEQSSMPETKQPKYPSHGEMEHFYRHLEDSLTESRFLVPQHPGQTLDKLRRLFNRARPEKQELSILRGILSTLQSLARERGDS